MAKAKVEGDGVWPILEQVCAPVDRMIGAYQFDPEGTVKGLAIAQAHFGSDKRGHLKLLLALMAKYAEVARGEWRSRLRSHHVVAVAEKLLVDLKDQRQVDVCKTYIQLGILVHTLHNNPDLAKSLLDTADDMCKEAPEHLKSALEAKEDLYKGVIQMTGPNAELEPILLRLIKLNEEDGSLDVVRRNRLAVNYCLVADFAAMSRMLLTCYERLDSLKKADRAEVLINLGTCYLEQGDFAKAKTVLDQAYKLRPDAARVLLARACFGTGDYKQSAELLLESVNSPRP